MELRGSILATVLWCMVLARALDAATSSSAERSPKIWEHEVISKEQQRQKLSSDESTEDYLVPHISDEDWGSIVGNSRTLVSKLWGQPFNPVVQKSKKEDVGKKVLLQHSKEDHDKKYFSKNYGLKTQLYGNESESNVANINKTEEVDYQLKGLLEETITTVSDISSTLQESSTVTELPEFSNEEILNVTVLFQDDKDSNVTKNLYELKNNVLEKFVENSTHYKMKSENQSESVDNLSKSISSRESRFSEQSSVSYENYNGSSSFLSKENENDAENDEMEVLLPLRLSHLESAVHLIRGRLCREHAKRVLEAFRQRKMWAMHMYDSSAKMADGVLAGSVYQMGNYDECVSVRAPPIRGQYCLTEISLNINNTQSNILTEKQVLRTSRDTLLRWAVCVPATCSARDVERLLRALTVHLRDTDAPSLRVHVPSRMCSAVHDSMPPVTLLQVIYGCTIVSFLLLVSTATIFHGVRTILGSDDVTKKASLFCQIIVCFSLMQNVRKIVSIPRANELKLDCIAGIRFLAMVFVICGHSLVFIVSGPILNDKFYNNAITKIENAFLLNNPLLVDTFLFLSGFLLCRLLFPELSVHKKKSQKGGLLAALYIGRYIRLTPAYAAVLGLYCTWLERIGDGPLWTSKIIPEHNRCKISWWTNLLYINNYIHTDNLCMFQSWYLSVDTQLYILAPLVIYPLWKWPKIGRYLLGLVTLTFIALPGILTYVNNLDPTLMAYALEVRDLSTNSYFINVYIKTHMRASAYCIGLLFGYIVYLIQTNKVNIKSTWAHSCSILSMIIGLGSMFSVIVFYQPNHYASNIENALYNALSRVGWCLAIGWLIIACITDNGGFVQRFLCWKPFQPLSRLTYCAYLVNGLVVLHASASVRNPQYMSVYSLFCHCSAHIVITFGLALIICLLFESPIHGLEKILMQKFNKKPVNNKESVPVNAVSVTTIQVG